MKAAPWFAGVWSKCAGSVKMSNRFPDLAPDAPKRVEGRIWHKAAQRMPETGEMPADSDMAEGALLYADALKALAPLETWRIEARVPCSLIHAEIPDGDADAISFHGGWLRSADYKAGHGYVDDYQNAQQLLYLIAEAKRLALNLDAIKCSITVVQPRYYGPQDRVRTWEFAGTLLRDWEVVLAAAAERTGHAVPPTLVGPWCGKCQGARGCTDNATAASGIAEWAGEDAPFDPTPVNVGGELRMLLAAERMLKDRRTAMEAQALHLIDKGQAVPGFIRGQVASRETVPAEHHAEVIEVAALLGVDVAQPRAPITPAQMRKKGLDEAVISKYAVRPPGAVKLQAVDPKTTERMFQS